MLRVLTCKTCSATFEVHITKEQWKLWREGQLIQHAMPHLTPNERELIISGICGECFEKMFAEEPDIDNPDDCNNIHDSDCCCPKCLFSHY